MLFPRYYQFGSNIERHGDDNLKLMSYNVHVFGRWQGDYNIDDKIELATNVFTRVEENNPDIICFQEFYSRPKLKLNNKLRALKQGYIFSASTKYLDYEDNYSIMIYSKYPIVNSGQLRAPGQNKYFAVYADVKLPNNDVVRVYNLHLRSIKISKEKELMNKIPDISNEEENKKLKEESISIIKKMKFAFVNRAAQVDVLTKHIESTDLPVIIAGDFNDTPVSYAYQKLRKYGKDVFTVVGKGMGISYRGGFPLLRIDYVFTDSEFFTPRSYETLQGEESDHKAVVVELGY